MYGFPDFLYQADPKSIAGPLLQWRTFRGATTQASVSITLTLPIDIEADRVFLLTTLSFEARCAPGQEYIANAIAWHGESVGNAQFMDFEPPEVTDVKSHKQHLMNYLMAPRRGVIPTIVWQADFSAGALNNTMIIDAAGWLLPRGNIQT